MNEKPQIIISSISPKGFHNTNPDTYKRMETSNAYKDLSTVCIIPSRGLIHAKVVQNWMAMMTPMNQQFVRIFSVGLEIGEAYDKTIEMILEHPQLKKFKYIMTLEDDVIPPPDGALKLYENIDKYDVVSGLYWTKGEGGMPMIYGNPKKKKDFSPQPPQPDTIQPARGLGMGFNLFKMKIFKDEKFKRPWFKTHQEFDYQKGGASFTQDLYFYKKAGELGYKFACDTRIKCGHFSVEQDLIW